MDIQFNNKQFNNRLYKIYNNLQNEKNDFETKNVKFPDGDVLGLIEGYLYDAPLSKWTKGNTKYTSEISYLEDEEKIIVAQKIEGTTGKLKRLPVYRTLIFNKNGKGEIIFISKKGSMQDNELIKIISKNNKVDFVASKTVASVVDTKRPNTNCSNPFNATPSAKK